MCLYDVLDLVEPHHKMMVLTMDLEMYRELQRLNSNLKLGRTSREKYTYTPFTKRVIDPKTTLKESDNIYENGLLSLMGSFYFRNALFEDEEVFTPEGLNERNEDVAKFDKIYELF